MDHRQIFYFSLNHKRRLSIHTLVYDEFITSIQAITANQPATVSIFFMADQRNCYPSG